MFSGDTIAAVSSATGTAARMIVRLSGPAAMAIASGVAADGRLPPPGGALRSNLLLRGMSVPCWIYCFRAPRSYNGEDLVELHIPGNPLLARMLVEDLLKAGARAAGPGEFTARAYLNGRIDLTEAEGVAATIVAGNEQELAASRQLLSGELSRRVAPIMEALAGALALVEAGIDFADEGIAFISADDLASRIAVIERDLSQLLRESARFERLSHEPVIVLAGRPNAGKSTLLNRLAGRQRAVVSPAAGTTRDVLSAQVALPRGLVRLVDVAGLDESPASSPDDLDVHRQIESAMRAHALRAMEQADYLMLVRDIADAQPEVALGRPADLVVRSKLDLSSQRGWPAANEVCVSALSGEGIGTLIDRLDRLCFGQRSGSATLALTARHVQAIEESGTALARAATMLGETPELIAADLRTALDALGQIRGQVSADDLLGLIFSTFCIGK